MEKYLEELSSGDAFVADDVYYLVTTDFKQNGKRLCYDLSKGQPRWFDSNYQVNHMHLYTMDNSNNFMPIKNTESTDKTNIRN
jgi:hypothetical protein